MKLYRTDRGPYVERNGSFFAIAEEWDALVNRDDLPRHVEQSIQGVSGLQALEARVLAPVGTQEVWAAGVTYTRSRTARMEESKDAGGGSFYDRVYDAERPELFFKCAGWRARATGDGVRIRRDATWNVPEPEIALFVNARGTIVGFTIGNDMSSRDIEGENPLYLPQAKIYDGACALGPALVIVPELPPADTSIRLMIARDGAEVFCGETSFARMRRDPRELAEFLFRETTFPAGCVLLTGTGVVPPDDFTLRAGDEVRIDVAGIGALVNTVE